LALNGLRMVCVAEPAPAEQNEAVVAHTAPEECEEICLVHRPQIRPASPATLSIASDQTHAEEICLLAPNDDDMCAAAFAFAVASPAVAIGADLSQAVSQLVPESPLLYSNPALTSLSPPPKA
jgi:hypothetical protein